MHSLKDKSVFAFDLDHTLLRANSSYLFSKHLLAHKIFSFSQHLYCLKAYLHYKLFGCPLRDLHEKTFKRLFHKKPYSIFAKEIAPFWKKLLPEIFNTKLMQRLEEAKKCGAYLVLVTSAPAFLSAPVSDYLGCDALFATEYALDAEGRFCHLSRLVDGPAKANFLNTFATQKGIDKQHVWAYSDSIDDLPFLEAAGRPIAVSPDRKLKALSLKRQWMII